MREAGKVFNLGLVDKELCEPNIEHVRIQRKLTVGVRGMRKSPLILQKPIYDCSAEQSSPHMPHISTSVTTSRHLSEGNGPMLATHQSAHVLDFYC